MALAEGSRPEAIGGFPTRLCENSLRAPGFPLNYVFLAIVYSELGQVELARVEIANLLAIVPAVTARLIRERWAMYRTNDLRARYFDGLRKAGLPE